MTQSSPVLRPSFFMFINRRKNSQEIVNSEKFQINKKTTIFLGNVAIVTVNSGSRVYIPRDFCSRTQETYFILSCRGQWTGRGFAETRQPIPKMESGLLVSVNCKSLQWCFVCLICMRSELCYYVWYMRWVGEWKVERNMSN